MVQVWAVPYFLCLKLKVVVILEIYNGTYCVYVHTNKINWKKYVGQTVHGDRPQKRWDNGNGYKNCTYFYKAIQKYGWGNFEHEIVANNLTAQEADNFEKLLIEKFDTMCSDKGYNLEPGGTKNKILSEVTKKKISEAISGEKNGNYGKQMSVEQKQKISQSKKGKYIGESNSFYGRHHTEETKKKISEANKGEKATNAKMVVQMDDDYHVIKIWKYIADAYRTLEINRQSIQNVLHGKRQHAGGYRWFYLYDNTKKDGTIIKGVISLGYITEEEIENAKSISV